MARKFHNKNWKNARKHFNIEGEPSMVLHHVDDTLMHNDIDRYLEWRPEDLVAIPNSEHSRIHNLGKTVSEETRSKISHNHVGFLGKHHTEESKIKISAAHKGKPKSEETKRKMRENHAIIRGADHPSSRKVLCIELDEIFHSAGEASRKLGISKSGILRCCNRIKYYKTAGGYHWRFV